MAISRMISASIAIFNSEIFQFLSPRRYKIKFEILILITMNKIKWDHLWKKKNLLLENDMFYANLFDLFKLIAFHLYKPFGS